MTDQPDDRSGYTGYQVPTSAGSERNTDQLHIGSAHDERRSTMPVRIVAVHGGGVDAAPTVDVAPILHQTDGLGYPTPHGTIYGVAVGRVHSGSGAVISDPVVGDIYQMHVHDRDLSKVKANGGTPSTPDTFRRSSPSDGVLGHAMLTKPPPSYLMWHPGGGTDLFGIGGALVQFSPDGHKVTIKNASGTTVVIKDGMTYVGGDPDLGGSFDFLMTASGPCKNAKGLKG